MGDLQVIAARQVREPEALLAVWQRLCGLFGTLRFFRPTREDLVLSLKSTSKALANDHVTLNLHSRRWREALALMSGLSASELAYLKELSSVNLAHLGGHLKMQGAVWFGVFSAFTWALSNLTTFFPGLGLGTREIVFALGGGVVGGSVLILKLYQSKWQAMELDTCVQLALARARLREPGPDPS
jgi:hypothetical protein